MSASKSGSNPKSKPGVPNSDVWKKQTVDPACERVICPPHDPIRDFRMEPTGTYVLIRLDREKGMIEAALCTREHKIFRIFVGKKCQDVYHAIFEWERRSGSWFESPEHIAYLGKELKKAELSLETNSDYCQE